MNKITFPLNPPMRGQTVADLHRALQACLQRVGVLSIGAADRHEIEIVFQRDVAMQSYGSVTRKLVGSFQEARHWQVTGSVDERTADALNSLLLEWGMLDGAPGPIQHTVGGVLRDDAGGAMGDILVRAVTTGDGVVVLGESRTDAYGRYAISYLLLGSEPIELKVLALRADGQAMASAGIPAARVNETLDLVVHLEPASPGLRLHGRVVFDYGLAAERLKLRLYRRDFGGTSFLLHETETVAEGNYVLATDDAAAVSLEIRAVSDSGSEVVISKPLNNLVASASNELNLIAPGSLRPLASEHQRLSVDLMSHLALAELAGARETADRQDLTILNRATGWDARLIALAARAEGLAADPELGLPRDALYGLLRAGLPSDKSLLANIDPSAAENALKAMREASIVEMSDQEIATYKQTFTNFRARARLEVKAPGSRASYGELLKQSGLDGASQDKFASIFLAHRGDAAQLWSDARAAGLDDRQIGRLRLQGKLAFLAGNSQAMTTRLLDKQISDPAQLVDADLHRADAWQDEVLVQAGVPLQNRDSLTADDKVKLDAVIPASYAGDDVEARFSAYTSDMARKVRLSYPTQVVSRLVEQGEIKLPEAQAETASLLRTAGAHGFRLGQTSVAAHFKSRVLDGGGAPGESNVARKQLETLHRVYQITPSNESMSVLMELGLTSAYDVTALPPEEFSRRFVERYLERFKKPPPPQEAELVYRKASQVSSVTCNLFTIAKKLGSEPTVAALSAPIAVRDEVRNELVKQIPSMESLFGSMDYCECEHCRSVLSPAAYLVDLLQSLEEWASTMGVPAGFRNPYEVLVEHRPDIPNIALTCENTHTTLPLIDIGNEILEYFVANGRLDANAAHDTGDTSSAALLAEPLNVVREAYAKLREAKYPINLPFDLWLETVREFCKQADAPLAKVLATFSRSDDFIGSAGAIGWLDVCLESLGISQAEAELLTDPDPLSGGKWQELYGLPADRPKVRAINANGTATLSIDSVSATNFRPGIACSIFDASANSMGTEFRTVRSIGEPDSAAAGLTVVSFDAEWTTPPEAGDELVCDATALLGSAKTLSRRLGVSYKEIAEIIGTHFVNPALASLTMLHKLGISINDVRGYRANSGLYEQNKDLLGQRREDLGTADQVRYDALSALIPGTQETQWDDINEVHAIEQALARLAEAFGLASDELRDQLKAVELDRIVVLADTGSGCNFDLTLLRNGDGSPVDAITLLRINLFVRLWRKLGWSIRDTDRALKVFIPSNAPFEVAHLHERPLQTALVYLAHLKELDARLRPGKDSLARLLTLWSDIPTVGSKSLYAQLFLAPGMLKAPAVFDEPFGRYLAAGDVDLKPHLLAVQGTLGLDSVEVGLILAEAGLSIDTAKLTLANVSLLYRHDMLAKALKLSVSDLISLKQLSGLDPFMPLHADPLADSPAGVTPMSRASTLDYACSQTLRFIEIASQLRDIGLKVQDLDYLLRHRFDPAGKYRQDSSQALALLKQISDGVRAIHAEHPLESRFGPLEEDALRSKLSLALPPEAVDQLVRMIDGTAEFTVTQPGVTEAERLVASGFEGERAIGELRYDHTRQQQSLTIRLFDPNRAGLEARHPSAVFAQLLAEAEVKARDFFNNQLRKAKLRPQDSVGFLDDADYNLLFAALQAPVALSSTDDQQQLAQKRAQNDAIARQNNASLQGRFDRVAQAFIPLLRQRLTRRFIVDTMTARTGASAQLVEMLLVDERVLGDPTPLIEPLTASSERGVTATFFAAADGSGDDLSTVTLPQAFTGVRTAEGSLIRPATANSARIEGFIEVPAPGAYRFEAVLGKQGSKARLRFAHLTTPTFDGPAAQDGDVVGDAPNEYLELRPGTLYRFTLDVQNLGGGDVHMLVQGDNIPRGPLTQLAVYPAASATAALRAATLLEKASRWIQSLGLSEGEVGYFSTHAAVFGDFSLGELPTASEDDTPATRAAAKKRFDAFLRIADYNALKLEMAATADDMVAILAAHDTGGLGRAYERIAAVARRSETAIQATAEALFAVPAFVSERPLRRLWDALRMADRFGAPVASIVKWTRIASADADDDARFDISREVRDTVKSRVGVEAWQRIAKPMFDRLRQRQRDALVAQALWWCGFDRVGQLFDYFLIDPGMEPVVETSRIRLAISSVQIFIQRSLLNLVASVHPSSIDAKQWEWMKRYRVWEANRKIFLFPENWLEPEFRDEKSHLFGELEGALLQGDVSSDLVEDAFLGYLRKLDELARLDIVAMHLEEGREAASARTLHVFGRTYHVPHKYFYRRYARQMWTPWEPVDIDIEGNHLAPVVWRDRLYLFWVSFLEKPRTAPTGSAKAKISNAESHLSSTLGARVGSEGGGGSSAAPVASEPPKLVDITLSGAVAATRATAVQSRIEATLHWSEYLEGKWSSPELGDGSSAISTTPLSDFNADRVSVHVSKRYEGEEELGVSIHLGGAFQQSFYLEGRNSRPVGDVYRSLPTSPFVGASLDCATRRLGSGPVTVKFEQRSSSDPALNVAATLTVLGKAGSYALLPCNSALDSSEFGALVQLAAPIFFQDNGNTFYVEPSASERTIEEWQDWIAPPPQPDPGWGRPNHWRELDVVPAIPRKWQVPKLAWVSPEALVNPRAERDWLVNPSTGLLFDGEVLGPAGRSALKVMTRVDEAENALRVDVNPGSALGAASVVVREGDDRDATVELVAHAGGMNIVGSAGFDTVLRRNFTEFNLAGSGATRRDLR